MEVASPLPFGHVQTGTKRRFVCSPILDTTMGMESSTIDDFHMDDCNSFGTMLKKRRRIGSSDRYDANHLLTSPSVSLSSQENTSIQATTLGKPLPQDETSLEGGNNSTNVSLLQKIVERQNFEIQTLRQEKMTIQLSMKNLSDSHEKALHENKILKKAVTLQQQRQNQAVSEIESARQYKEVAESKIKMMEQVISSLRYHLQAQQPNVGNDFMGLNPRPPDVY